MKKVVLVTGGSSGIGASICIKLAQEGFIVYGTSRNPEANSYSLYSLIKLDVQDSLSVKNCINQILANEGKIDIVINNAGVGIIGSVEDCTDEEIFQAFDTNVFGVARTISTVLPHMRERKSGLIINIASIAGHMGLPYRGYYSATKSAVHRITESLRIETKNYGILATIIDPGDFNTNISNNRVVSHKLQTGSIYNSETRRIEELINSEISKSPKSDIIGSLVLKIINTKKPKVYYRIGKINQKLSVKLRYILGADVFEKILCRFYNIK